MMAKKTRVDKPHAGVFNICVERVAKVDLM